MSTSQLINDVGALPGVIGDMGLAIAQAQTLLDHNYLDAVQRLAGLVRSMLGTDAQTAAGAAAPDPEKLAAAREVMTAALRALAPTRYQYTETTLGVRLDLSRSVQAAVGLGVGASLGAVVVNASLMLGYAFDYRGAAEVKAVIHAAPAGEAVFDALLKRAGVIDDKALELPAPAKVDQALIDKAKDIFTAIAGAAPAAIGAAPATG